MDFKQNVKCCTELKEEMSLKIRDLREQLVYLVETLSQTDIQLFQFLRFVFELTMKENFNDTLSDVLKVINYCREKNEEKNKKYDDINYYTNKHSQNVILSHFLNLQNFLHGTYSKLFYLKAKLVAHEKTADCVNYTSIPKYINNRNGEANDECKKLDAITSMDAKREPQFKNDVKEDSFLVETLLKGSFRKTEKDIQGGKLNGELSDPKSNQCPELSGPKSNKCPELICPKSNKCPEVQKFEDGFSDYLDIVFCRRDFPLQPVEIAVFMQPSSHPNAIVGIPWDMFKREVCRILTFANYPVDAVKSALLLANAGFVYIGLGQGSDDWVKCYFCCGEKRNWVLLDEIHEVHRRISPNCAMVTRVHCDNIPLSSGHNSRPVISSNTSENESSNNGDAWSDLQTDSVLDITQPTADRRQTTADRRQPTADRRKPTADRRQPTADRRQHEFQLNGTQNNDRERMQANENYNLTDHSDTSFNPPPGDTGTFVTLPASFNFEQTNPHVQTSDSNSRVPPVSSNASQPSEDTLSHTPTPRKALNATTVAHPPLTHPPISSATPSSLILAAVVMEPDINATLTTEYQGAAAAEATNQAVATTDLSTAITEANENPNSGQTGGPTDGLTVGQTKSQGIVSSKTPTYSELGIITERPKRAEYARKQARVETFENWPRDHHLSPADLAEAGFYYAGYGDCARCFYCGGGLRNWEDEDDVWVEHARWFPKCAYIRQQKGQFFVDTVQELNKSFSAITLERVLTITRQSAFPTFDPKKPVLSQDPAVITVQQLGYAVNDVIQAALIVKEEFTIVSSDAILERLDRDGKMKVNPMNAILSIPSSNPKADLEMIQRLKEKNNQLRQQTVCKICMDQEVAVVFLPCGHLVSCAECASAMKDCPYCRQNIKGIVRTFIT